MRHHGYYMDNFMGNFGFFGILWIIIWLAIIIGGIILVIYILRRGNESKKGSSLHAIKILQERFARGEIDELEYQEKKRILEEE